jgi:hypothetical protein
MKNPTLHQWQKFANNTYRFAVPGGWLYRHDIIAISNYDASPSTLHSMLQYVPDHNAAHVVWETPEARAERERERLAAVLAHLDAHWQDGGIAGPGERVYTLDDVAVTVTATGLHVRDAGGTEWSTNLRGDAVTTAPIWSHPAVAPLVAIIRQETP